MEVKKMPCFINIFRLLALEAGEPVPERIEEYLNNAIMQELSVLTHDEAHKKMKEMDPAELKRILEKVLADVKKIYGKDGPPDRLKEQRKKMIEAS